MSASRGMFRIYTCGSCGNIGHVRVEQENDHSNCELCGALVIHGPGILYAVTTMEAREYVRDLVNQTEIERSDTKARSRGVKRRVTDIVRSLVELNRGRPVALETVLVECADAGIDVDRARHFLDLLINEGVIGNNDRGLRIEEEM